MTVLTYILLLGVPAVAGASILWRERCAMINRHRAENQLRDLDTLVRVCDETLTDWSVK